MVFPGCSHLPHPGTGRPGLLTPPLGSLLVTQLWVAMPIWDRHCAGRFVRHWNSFSADSRICRVLDLESTHSDLDQDLTKKIIFLCAYLMEKLWMVSFTPDRSNQFVLCIQVGEHANVTLQGNQNNWVAMQPLPTISHALKKARLWKKKFPRLARSVFTRLFKGIHKA